MSEEPNGVEATEEPMSTTVAKPKAKKKTAATKAKKTASAKANGAVTKKPAKPAKSAYGLREMQAAAILLKQASDSTRLQVLLMLAEGEKYVGELCAELNMSQPAVSHHLALLRHGGLIAPRRNGKQNFYELTDKGESLAKVVKAIVD